MGSRADGEVVTQEGLEGCQAGRGAGSPEGPGENRDQESGGDGPQRGCSRERGVGTGLV